MFKGKNILITGSEGMIAKELIEIIKEKGAIIHKADLKLGDDLTYFDVCLEKCKNMDYVFHLAGIKGSPKMTNENPADFFVPMVQFNTNILEASRRQGVKRLLYTSSIAVLNPESDKYPAWAKMTGEKQIEAYRIQYPNGMKSCIVRPANVYGKYDNFNAKNPMVITDLIRKAFLGDLDVWGDGSQIRDFINAKDVANAMILCIEKMPEKPINIGSGKEYTIKQIAGIITENTNANVSYDKSKNIGDKKRVMDITHLKSLGFNPMVSIEEGVKEVIGYYRHSLNKGEKSI